MAVSIDPEADTAPLGVSIPGVPPPEPVEAVSDFERTVAGNLRQPSTCGKAFVRQMINDTEPEAEEKLAAFIAESGGLGLRRNVAGLLAQLQAASDNAERYRRALEALASNAHIAPAQYPAGLRAVLTEALGRAY